MRIELANLNHCAVLFLSRAAVNLNWYDSIYLYIYIYNFCVEVFEKTISRTKMITHSKGAIMECVVGYLKIFCAGTAGRNVRLKLKNCVLTMMLSTNRYKKHSRVFFRSFFNFCRSFKALQYPNQKILANKILIKYI